MKVFFIFKIKDEFISLYKENPSNLFLILRNIYKLQNNELMYGTTLFNQLINKFNKRDLDCKLFLKLHTEIPYSKRGDTHYFNNLYRNEVSRLIVKNTYLKIETDTNYPSFFKILGQFNHDLFVCNFNNSDFFWLDNAKTLV